MKSTNFAKIVIPKSMFKKSFYLFYFYKRTNRSLKKSSNLAITIILKRMDLGTSTLFNYYSII